MISVHSEPPPRRSRKSWLFLHENPCRIDRRNGNQHREVFQRAGKPRSVKTWAFRSFRPYFTWLTLDSLPGYSHGTIEWSYAVFLFLSAAQTNSVAKSRLHWHVLPQIGTCSATNTLASPPTGRGALCRTIWRHRNEPAERNRPSIHVIRDTRIGSPWFVLYRLRYPEGPTQSVSQYDPGKNEPIFVTRCQCNLFCIGSLQPDGTPGSRSHLQHPPRQHTRRVI